MQDTPNNKRNSNKEVTYVKASCPPCVPGRNTQWLRWVACQCGLGPGCARCWGSLWGSEDKGIYMPWGNSKPMKHSIHEASKRLLSDFLRRIIVPKSYCWIHFTFSNDNIYLTNLIKLLKAICAYPKQTGSLYVCKHNSFPYSSKTLIRAKLTPQNLDKLQLGSTEQGKDG